MYAMVVAQIGTGDLTAKVEVSAIVCKSDMNVPLCLYADIICLLSPLKWESTSSIPVVSPKRGLKDANNFPFSWSNLIAEGLLEFEDLSDEMNTHFWSFASTLALISFSVALESECPGTLSVLR